MAVVTYLQLLFQVRYGFLDCLFSALNMPHQPSQQLMNSCYLLWLWTFTYDYSIQTWPRYHQGQPRSQKLLSRHKQTHCSTCTTKVVSKNL